MDKNRILTLYKIFINKTNKENQLSMSEILEIMTTEGIPCCEKSIRNDIKQLRDVLNLNIHSRTGRNAKYYADSFILNLDEAKLVIDAINSYTYISHKDNEIIVDKIKKLVSEFEHKQLERNVKTITRFKTEDDNVFHNLEILNSAIKNDKQIKFDYKSWSENKELVIKNKRDKKQVSPFAIISSKGKYYLFAYKFVYSGTQRNFESRLYRLDKMCNIEESYLSRLGEVEFLKLDMDIFISRRKSMYDGPVEDIDLSIPIEKIGIFIDQFGADNICIKKKEGKRIRIKFKAVASRPFLGWLLGMGKVKILKPQTAIDKVNTMIKEFENNMKSKKI